MSMIFSLRKKENSLKKLLRNNYKIVIYEYIEGYPVVKINVDISCSYKEKLFLFSKLCSFNFNIINVLFYSDQKRLLDEIKVITVSYFPKLRTFYKKNIDFDKFPIKEYIEKSEINEVRGFMTPSFLFFYSKESNVDKISEVVTNKINKKTFFSYLKKFNYEFYASFLKHFHGNLLILFKSFQNFFIENDFKSFQNFLDFLIPNQNYLLILDKGGYKYYVGGWSFKRSLQVLNLLKSLNLNPNFFKGKDVMEVGPGLCDFIKIAKYCGSKKQYIIDKNPLFLMLGQAIGANDYIQFDFIKDDLDEVSFPKYDILFIKGFLNVDLYDKKSVERIVTLLTKNINPNGTGIWSTYNTYRDNMKKNEYKQRLSHLTHIFNNLGWKIIELSEKESEAAGFNYPEYVDLISFKIDK